jgi:hypothetical protein
MSFNFLKVYTVEQFWLWIRESFVSELRVEEWYNGQEVSNMKEYLNDYSSVLIGYATLRQVRIENSKFKKIQFSIYIIFINSLNYA